MRSNRCSRGDAALAEAFSLHKTSRFASEASLDEHVHFLREKLQTMTAHSSCTDCLPPQGTLSLGSRGNLAHAQRYCAGALVRQVFDMRVALYQPDIPQNTGTILRMAACLGVPVDIIGPAGFDLRDKTLRRAGLDYLEHVSLTRYESFEHFEKVVLSDGRRPRLVLLSAHASEPYADFRFAFGDVLMLGRESAGVPESVHARADGRVRIPMRPGLRSLNIAVAGAMVLGEALRQTGGFVSPCQESE